MALSSKSQLVEVPLDLFEKFRAGKPRIVTGNPWGGMLIDAEILRALELKGLEELQKDYDIVAIPRAR